MADIFLSYSRDDRAAIEPLAEQIVAAGYTVWWDKQLTGGKRYLEETEAELNGAKVVLVAWSKTSIVSHWVADEAGAGRDTGRLLPISLDGSMPPLGFRQFQTIDFSKWARDDGGALKQLMGALGNLTAPSGEANVAPKKKPAAPFGLPRNPLVLGLAAIAAVAVLAIAAMNLLAPSQTAGNNRLTAFFGFNAAGDDPAVSTIAGDANAETYRTFAALGLETASEASTSNVPLAQQLNTAVKLNARYAVGGDVRKSAGGFDISLRIDDTQSGKTLWRETLSGGEQDTVTLPVAAAEQAGGTVRCLIRMFKDIPRPSDELMTALPRACATRRLSSEDRVQAWRAAAGLAPDSPAVLAMLGSSLSAQRSSASGVQDEELVQEIGAILTRAQKLEPGLMDVQANLALNGAGGAANYDKRLAAAATASPGGVEPVEPGVPDMLRGLGLASAGQFADALPHFRRAVQADPLFYAAQGWLGMSLMENGQKREGRAVYGRVITRTASPFYWSSWAMQEISDPEALKRALELAPPGIAADTTDCLRSLAVVLTEKRPEAHARGVGPVLTCLQRTRGAFVTPGVSALGDLDDAFASVDQAGLTGVQSVQLQMTVTRPMRADPRFLPLMKKAGTWQYWVETGTMPDWCKLPEEQDFETCAELRKAQAK